MAANCCVRPLAIDGFAGVTAIDTSVAAVTVSVAVLLVVLPATLVTVTSNAVPLSVLVIAGVAYDDNVAQGMFPPFFRH